MPPGEKTDKPQLEAARAFLRRLIRARGVNLRDLDAQFGFTRGYISRVLRGETKLTYDHILEVLDAIDVDPSLYFTALHPPRSGQETESRRLEELRQLFDRLQHLLPPAGPVETPVAPSGLPAEVESRMEEALREVAAMRRTPRRRRKKVSRRG